ncbi:MAG: hypothetical protein A3F87_02775 [Omnitrophica WOR_2 bacterium RIFCSPLOWO2_12_FULL_51_24]|nr:MAG: hypothetical protein A3F87_02775 [Omnitrophica WOR_2 bacterium RIFCSPLOWO2_12_FULL_51_24]
MPLLSADQRKRTSSKKGIFPVFIILALILPLYCILSRRQPGVYLFTLNFSLVVIIAAAFEFGAARSYLISALVSVVTFVSMFSSRGFGLPHFASIIFLNLVPIIPSYINKKYTEYFSLKNSTLADSRRSYDEFTAELNVLKELNISLQNQVHDILDLYEVTKNMSASLEMGEMLRIFREAVNKISKSVITKVILIDESQDKPAAKVTYEIRNPSFGKPASSDIRSGPSGEFEQILAEAVFARKEMILLKSPIDKNHPFVPYLGDSGRSFIALPLLSEKIPIGILTIVGAEEEHTESFSILAEQLSLELKKISLYERIQELAITDGLTGLYVRRHFIERLNEELTRCKKHGLELSLLMIDLDHFKQCNDTHGHLVGDIALKEIAKIMREYVRQVDLVGRYGGEEFVIALPDTDKKSAMNVAERMRMSVEKHKFRAYDETIAMTISVGAANFPENGEDVVKLIDRADQALYKAKAEGRNRAVSYND